MVLYIAGSWEHSRDLANGPTPALPIKLTCCRIRLYNKLGFGTSNFPALLCLIKPLDLPEELAEWVINTAAVASVKFIFKKKFKAFVKQNR